MRKKFKLESRIYQKYKARYIKIKKNQLRIIDALMNDGGNTKKYYDKKGNLRYSEHSGLLDFGKSTLQRILVSVIPNVEDSNDNQILFPENIPDAVDYEYMFHTHPPTSTPLDRVKQEILYDMPSVEDLFHFMDHYNKGKIQGSIVVSSEGLYIIKAIDDKKKIVIKNENKVFKYLVNLFFELQRNALEKYKNHLNIKSYYNKIIKDKSFLKMYNEKLKKINIVIKYYPRIKYKNRYILNDLYLKVSPVE